jgi:2-oxoglutarate dehydrogenase complex dehydrogenase (E1) component-like enzyme
VFGQGLLRLLEERDSAGSTTSTCCGWSSSIPFPALALMKELERFKGAEIVWCQEEPKNQGAWTFVEPNLEWVLTRIGAKHTRPRYAGPRRQRLARDGPCQPAQSTTIRARERCADHRRVNDHVH